MTLIAMGIAVVLVADYFLARFMARRAFDKLTRERDGVPFVPFDECGIDRCAGVVKARMQCDHSQSLTPYDRVMMSINGIMTEMVVTDLRREYSSPLVEVDLQDARSYTAQRYVP